MSSRSKDHKSSGSSRKEQLRCFSLALVKESPAAFRVPSALPKISWSSERKSDNVVGEDQNDWSFSCAIICMKNSFYDNCALMVQEMDVVVGFVSGKNAEASEAAWSLRVVSLFRVLGTSACFSANRFFPILHCDQRTGHVIYASKFRSNFDRL